MSLLLLLPPLPAPAATALLPLCNLLLLLLMEKHHCQRHQSSKIKLIWGEILLKMDVVLPQISTASPPLVEMVG